MEVYGKIVTIILILLLLGGGIVVASGWLIKRDNPQVQPPDEPVNDPNSNLGEVPHENNRIAEGDGSSELVTGIDARGWHILTDQTWGVEIHFPDGWFFTRDQSVYLGNKYVSYTFRDKKVKNDSSSDSEYNNLLRNSWRVGIGENQPYDPDPQNGYTRPSEQSAAYLMDLGAKTISFNGISAYGITYEGSEDLLTDNRTLISFNENGKVYDIDVSAVPGQVMVWENAQYFLESFKILK